jgi:hypothetical protein
MQAEKWSLPEGVNLQETVYNVEGYTYQVDLHELPSGIFGILHMPAVWSVQIHDWEVKSEPGGSAYVSHNIYITVLLTPSLLRLKSKQTLSALALQWRKEGSKQKDNWNLQHCTTPQWNFIIGIAYTKLCDLSSFYPQCVPHRSVIK